MVINTGLANIWFNLLNEQYLFFSLFENQPLNYLKDKDCFEFKILIDDTDLQWSHPWTNEIDYTTVTLNFNWRVSPQDFLEYRKEEKRIKNSVASKNSQRLKTVVCTAWEISWTHPQMENGLTTKLTKLRSWNFLIEKLLPFTYSWIRGPQKSSQSCKKIQLQRNSI